MAPSNSFYASSPTVVLPPNGPAPYPVASDFAQQALNPDGFLNVTNVPPTTGTIATASGSLAGRKRSRGDTDAPEDDEDNLEDGSVRTPPTGEYEQPVGKQPSESEMNIDDSNGFSLMESDPGSLGGETSGRESANPATVNRPSVTSRKSQRMGSAPSGVDDLAQLVLPPQMRDVTTEPLIDEATRALGISWTRMDSSEALRINQAAYGKWIQNHYPGLRDVAIWFENSAIPGYLVMALNAYNGQHEYYIFSNDLTEARLVTSEPSQLVPRLKMLPALHLAAPGGCIRAETDPITTAQNDVSAVQVAMVDDGDATAQASTGGDKVQKLSDTRDDSVEPLISGGMCNAHQMELD